MFHLAPAHGKSTGILNGVVALNAMGPFKVERQLVLSGKAIRKAVAVVYSLMTSELQ